MKHELISVIVPIYNREGYLDKCLNSIITQTEVETEIILIDDGSTDTSPQIIDDYASSHANIKAIHIPNGGVSHARNVGLDMATGDYISFVDSDDFLEPNALCTMKETLCETGADYCIGRINFFSDAGNLDHTMVFPEHYHNQLLSKDMVWQTLLDVDYPIFDICTPKLYKKELWKDIRFIEGKTSEDTMALLEIQKKSSTVYFLDDVVYNITLSAESLLRCRSTVSLIDEARADLLLSDYLVKNGFYNAAFRRFGDGTRSLITAQNSNIDQNFRKDIRRIYKDYRKVSQSLFSFVNTRNKVRFLIFQSSFTLYSFIRNVKEKTGTAH